MVKLNHNVDSDIQRFSQFNSYFQLSKDKTYLEIINKKPVDQPSNILHMDERELYIQKQNYFEDKVTDIKRKFSGMIVQLEPEEAEKQGIEHDLLLEFQIKFL